MYLKFREKYSLDSGAVSTRSAQIDFEVDSYLYELFEQFGGGSFNGGLYRVAEVDSIHRLGGLASGAFREYSPDSVCFGFDWLGRIFAADPKRPVGGHPGVIMLEPGTAQILEIPCNVRSFHEIELIDYSEEALASSFFSRWISSGGRAPDVTECIGYKRPLFLGGHDTIENLEKSDMDVYWSICGQLISGTRDLPVGSRVGNIDIG